MQWRNGRDIQGGQISISESPSGGSVYHMFICIDINIFNVATVWTVSFAAHLTLWGKLYQLSVTAQQQRQTQSHKLFRTVSQELSIDYHHLDIDTFFVVPI